jgi:hypothetical protein
MLERVRSLDAEALVDVHNNTGHNPAYGVLVGNEARHLALVELFAPRCVLNTLRLGTMVEALEPRLTSVVIECGQAGDRAADELAYRGICAYLEADVLPAHPREEMQIFKNSMRVTVDRGRVLAFAEAPDESADLTLKPSLEHFNFQSVPEGTVLGWSKSQAQPLHVIDSRQCDRSQEFLEVVAGEIRARTAFVPIMMTARADIAASDCLCYFVEDF